MDLRTNSKFCFMYH